MSLITAPNFEATDDFYEALLNAHKDLDAQDSHALNARLILILANHIGKQSVLTEALATSVRTAPVSKGQA
ncbi:DUF2783 domain-containing protein [Aquabacterium sp.]|uniref:DUF2783 domain-containing protein n=1 Tax=Aquabacterium sp. TaxID=1872578 RepID=UPI003BB1AC88